MRPLSFIAALLFLLSCNNQSINKKADVIAIDTLQPTLKDTQQKNVSIKSPSLYDQSFIDGLAAYSQPSELIDNFIITGNDTTYFPEDLPLNKKTVFKGTVNNKTFLLSVTRTNLTNLNYVFQLTDKDGKTIGSRSGKAVLGHMFFLASEVDEDSQTADAYGSSEYWDEANDCWFSIRIGIGLDHNRKQRAMLTYGCEDKSKQTFNIDDCPTLRTE